MIGGSAAALPVPRPTHSPAVRASASPAGSPVTRLAFGSEAIFVLDDRISSSANKAGDVIRMHLKSDLRVGGRVVAPAGTPDLVHVVDTSAAQMLDRYGFVDIYVDPLHLPDGREIPLGVATTRLSPRDTAGHESTVAIENTLEDIVVPYAVLFQIARHGRNFVIGAGAELKTRLLATLRETRAGIAIETPQPFAATLETPGAAFQALPIARPMPHAPPPPTPAPPPPTATPSPTPTPSVSPTPT
ncbi:MAG: hypothetical protein ACYC8W_05725 [Candidatus Tyrphobacter sp.]